MEQGGGNQPNLQLHESFTERLREPGVDLKLCVCSKVPVLKNDSVSPS